MNVNANDGNSMNVVFAGATKVISPYAASAINSDNPFNATINSSLALMNAKNNINNAKSCWSELKTAYETVNELDDKANLTEIMGALKGNAQLEPSALQHSSFFNKNSETINNVIKGKDKSINEVIQHVNPELSKKIEQSKLISETTAKMNTIGITVSFINQLPKILKAFKNGDGMEQVGRSAVTVGGSTIIGTTCSVIGEKLLRKVGLGRLGATLGSAIGYTIGGKVSTKAAESDFMFGKALPEKS